MSSNKRSRKYLLTINNPEAHNMTHEVIKDKLNSMSKINYWCMCDELGSCYHTHLYIHFENPRTFQTIKNAFPSAHIEAAFGTALENRDYIRKDGKHADTDKSETNIKDTFEEFGTVPEEHQGKRSDIAEAKEMLADGFTVNEVIDQFPHMMFQMNSLKQYRQSVLFEKYRKTTRELTVIYQYGDTGTGKSRGVYEKHGFENVYAITNYENPFDAYDGESVIMFEEFRGQIQLSAMLQYLDRYPCRLPARFFDKVACYTTVYINSNIPLDKQYRGEQDNEPRSYDALIRRINKVFEFKQTTA